MEFNPQIYLSLDAFINLPLCDFQEQRITVYFYVLRLTGYDNRNEILEPQNSTTNDDVFRVGTDLKTIHRSKFVGLNTGVISLRVKNSRMKTNK